MLCNPGWQSLWLRVDAHTAATAASCWLGPVLCFRVQIHTSGSLYRDHTLKANLPQSFSCGKASFRRGGFQLTFGRAEHPLPGFCRGWGCSTPSAVKSLACSGSHLQWRHATAAWICAGQMCAAGLASSLLTPFQAHGMPVSQLPSPLKSTNGCF